MATESLCRLPAVVLSAFLLQAAWQPRVWAEPLPQAVLDAHENAENEANKKRTETYTRKMNAAIKQQADLGLKQKLEKLRDDTLANWAPPERNPPINPPNPAPQNDRDLLAKVKRRVKTTSVEVKNGVVTLKYDFTAPNVQQVLAADFTLPAGIDRDQQAGVVIPAQKELVHNVPFTRVDRFDARFQPKNVAGEWVWIGDDFGVEATKWNAICRLRMSGTIENVTIGAASAPFSLLLELGEPDRLVLTYGIVPRAIGGAAAQGPPAVLATPQGLPNKPRQIRLQGGTGGSGFKGFEVVGEIDPAWLQVQLQQ